MHQPVLHRNWQWYQSRQRVSGIFQTSDSCRVISFSFSCLILVKYFFKQRIRFRRFELEYDRYSIENPQVARVVPDISSSVVSKTCDDIPRNAKSNDESTALQLNVDFNSMDCPTKVCFKHRGNETREETNDGKKKRATS